MDWVIVAATVVIACSAVVSGWMTWRLCRDNRTLLKAGTEPEVVAYLAPDPRSGFLIDLVLENVGQGPACDVQFFVDADPGDFAKHEVTYVPARTSRKIKSLLPQGERVGRLLGVGNHLYSEDDQARLQPFCVKVWYSNLKGARIGPKEYALDIAELGGSAQIDPSEERLAKSIEKIERHLREFASDLKARRRRAHVRQLAGEKQKSACQQEVASAEAAEEEAS